MSDPLIAPPLPRRTRRKRPPAVIIAELRALGGIVIERAIAHEGDAAQADAVQWARALATELGAEGALDGVCTWSDLALALSRVHAASGGADAAAPTQPRARQRMRRARP